METRIKIALIVAYIYCITLVFLVFIKKDFSAGYSPTDMATTFLFFAVHYLMTVTFRNGIINYNNNVFRSFTRNKNFMSERTYDIFMRMVLLIITILLTVLFYSLYF